MNIEKLFDSICQGCTHHCRQLHLQKTAIIVFNAGNGNFEIIQENLTLFLSSLFVHKVSNHIEDVNTAS